MQFVARTRNQDEWNAVVTHADLMQYLGRHLEFLKYRAPDKVRCGIQSEDKFNTSWGLNEIKEGYSPDLICWKLALGKAEE